MEPCGEVTALSSGDAGKGGTVGRKRWVAELLGCWPGTEIRVCPWLSAPGHSTAGSRKCPAGLPPSAGSVIGCVPVLHRHHAGPHG